MIWRAQTGPATRTLKVTTVALVAVSAVLAVVVLALPLSIYSLAPAILALLGLLAALASAALYFSIASLRYRLAHTGIQVEWLSHRAHVPYASIDGVFSGNRLGPTGASVLIQAGGARIGEGRDVSGKPVYYFASVSDGERTAMVTTSAGTFVLSPIQGASFRRELINRIEAAGEQEPPSEPSVAAWPWEPLRDSLMVITFSLALVLLFVLLGALFDRFEALPPQLALQFDASGQPHHMAPKADLFSLPTIGGVSLLFNTAVGFGYHRAEPILARLLWLASPLVQALLLISLMRILQ